MLLAFLRTFEWQHMSAFKNWVLKGFLSGPQVGFILAVASHSFIVRSSYSHHFHALVISYPSLVTFGFLSLRRSQIQFSLYESLLVHLNWLTIHSANHRYFGHPTGQPLASAVTEPEFTGVSSMRADVRSGVILVSAACRLYLFCKNKRMCWGLKGHEIWHVSFSN